MKNLLVAVFVALLMAGCGNGISIGHKEKEGQLNEIPEGIVFRTKMASHTWREAQYHLDTGELFLIGEQTHGYDHYTTGGNDIWWCYMNTSDKGSGLIEFLMDRNKKAKATKEKAIANGWRTYGQGNYSFLELRPLPSQNTFINLEAPRQKGGTDTTEAYTTDYQAIDNSKVFYTIYRNANNGKVYSGVGGPSVKQAVGSLPPGDGSLNRDNGVRADIAFKARIPLSDSDKWQLFKKFPVQEAIYDDTSKAYHYVHPHGL